MLLLLFVRVSTKIFNFPEALKISLFIKKIKTLNWTAKEENAEVYSSLYNSLIPQYKIEW